MRSLILVAIGLGVLMPTTVVADPYPAEFTDVFLDSCILSESDRRMCECVLYEMERAIPYAKAIDSNFPLEERVTELALACIDREETLDAVNAEIQADIQAERDAAALALANEAMPPHEALGFTFDIPEGWVRVPPFSAQFTTPPYLVLQASDGDAFIQLTALAGDLAQPIEDIAEASAKLKALATSGSDDLMTLSMGPDSSLKVKKIEDRVVNGLALIETRLELSIGDQSVGLRVFYFVPPRSAGEATLIYIWDLVEPEIAELFIESLRPLE